MTVCVAHGVPVFTIGRIDLHRRILASGGEGTVWKRLDQSYEPGRRVTHWLKRKRETTVEAFVTGSKPGTPGHGHADLVGAVEFWPAFVEQALRPALDDLRAAHALPPDPTGLMSHRYLTITGLPPEWVGPHEHRPPTTHFVRPVPFDDRAASPAPAWLAELPAQPTVHASLGTVFTTVPGLYEDVDFVDEHG